MSYLDLISDVIIHSGKVIVDTEVVVARGGWLSWGEREGGREGGRDEGRERKRGGKERGERRGKEGGGEKGEREERGRERWHYLNSDLNQSKNEACKQLQSVVCNVITLSVSLITIHLHNHVALLLCPKTPDRTPHLEIT